MPLVSIFVLSPKILNTLRPLARPGSSMDFLGELVIDVVSSEKRHPPLPSGSLADLRCVVVRPIVHAREKSSCRAEQ